MRRSKQSKNGLDFDMCRFSQTEGRRGFERERKHAMVWRERENEGKEKQGINKSTVQAPLIEPKVSEVGSATNIPRKLH